MLGCEHTDRSSDQLVPLKAHHILRPINFVCQVLLVFQDAQLKRAKGLESSSLHLNDTASVRCGAFCIDVDEISFAFFALNLSLGEKLS